MPTFQSTAATHVGLVRENNEDSGYAGPHLILVADGVGGQAAGEVASASTTYVVSAMAMFDPGPDLPGALAEIVTMAKSHLTDGVSRDPERTGMSTTLTAMLTDGERFALAHVGDSRGYLLRDGRLRQITRDHTLVQELIDDGQITREQARNHPYRSVVLHALDAENEPRPDIVLLDLREGDRILLCSDGLSDYVTDDRIEELLRYDRRERARDALIEAALEGGGRDNITCVVADIEPVELTVRYGQLVGATLDPDNLIDPAAIRDPLRHA